jgi:hypothetical protein
MNHRPVAIGLLACEQVIVDVSSRNLTPVNCFGVRQVPAIPGTTDFHVVAWLADGLGEMSVELIVKRLDNLDEVYQAKKVMKFDDPLKDMRFTARIRDCPIPVPGYYEITLVIDGESVGHRRLQFLKIGES